MALLGFLWERLMLPALDRVEGHYGYTLALKCLAYITASKMNPKQWALSEKKPILLHRN